MKRDGGGHRTTTWRALEGSPSLSRTGTPAVLHVLPVRLPLRPLVPGSLMQSRALGERVDWQRRPGRPLGQVFGLDVGRLWRCLYRGRVVLAVVPAVVPTVLPEL